MTNAVGDIPRGDVQAAHRRPGAEATERTADDHPRPWSGATIPNFERDIQRQIAEAKPRVEQSIKALNRGAPGR